MFAEQRIVKTIGVELTWKQLSAVLGFRTPVNEQMPGFSIFAVVKKASDYLIVLGFKHRASGI